MGSAKPVLIDQFLEEATEVDVDALADGTDVVIGGIMEHIEEAGVHSGDSSCVLPPVSLSPAVLETIRDYTKRLALALKVVGLMNVQYAIQRDTVYVLEVNPRASRTVPYVSKATGVPLAKVAARIMVGKKLKDLSRTSQVLCVTHLPQIATFADHHYRIEKKESAGRAKTTIRNITGDERTGEVARMLSGAKVTESSLKHAEQMIKANA